MFYYEDDIPKIVSNLFFSRGYTHSHTVKPSDDTLKQVRNRDKAFWLTPKVEIRIMRFCTQSSPKKDPRQFSNAGKNFIVKNGKENLAKVDTFV
jgi:hypothetical protein